MKRMLLLLCATAGLTSTLASADKPEWAGQGGKPTDQQVQDHRDEMREKNAGKPGKDVEHGKLGAKGDKDQNGNKNKNKEKEKEKEKSKGKGNDTNGRDNYDRDGED